MATKEIFLPTEIQPENVRPEDDAQILVDIPAATEGKLHVYRLGRMITVGNAEQSLHVALVKVASPHTDTYAEMVAEARPAEGIPPHHPV